MSIKENWSPVWLADGWDDDYVVPRPQWVEVDGGLPLLYPGEFHMLYGRGGHGKTMFAIAAAVAMARKGLRTVFLDYEGTEGLTRHRLKAMGLTKEQASLVGYQKMLDGMRPADVEHVNVWCQMHEVQLLIVDSVARALASAGLDEIDNKGFAEFIQMLEPLRSGTQAVLLIDHIGHLREQKEQSDFVPTPRGASAKVDQVALAIYFKQVKAWNEENSGHAELICKKCRHGHFAEGDTMANMYVNVSDGGIHVAFAKPATDARVTGLSDAPIARAIIELLEEGEQDGVEKMVAEVARRTKKRADTCRATLDQMVQRGTVTMFSKGPGKSTSVRLLDVA